MNQTRPFVRTTIDLRLERPDRSSNDLFHGWGISLTASRLL